MARGGEHLAQNRCHPLRFLVDLLFAEPQNLESPRTKLEVPPPVVPKGLAAPVVAIAVRLHGKTTVAPEKVDEVRPNADVDPGKRQPMSSADPQEVALEVAAGAISANVLAERESQHVTLPNRAAKLARRYAAP